MFVGQKMKVVIDDIAFGGNGVGRNKENIAVFVPFSAPEDEIMIEVVKMKKNFAEAKILEIVKPSPFRVAPKSENYEKSSVSQYEHIDYKKQLEIKEVQLLQQLQRIGKLDLEKTEKLPIVPSEKIYNYRNKIVLHPLREKNGDLVYGFYGLDNKTIEPIFRCELVVERISELIPKINKMKWGKTNATRPSPLDCTMRIDATGEAHAFFGKAPDAYPWLEEKINGMTVKVPLGSFFQVNIPVAEKLFQTVAKWVEESKLSTVIDAYCGVGVFSLHFPTEMNVLAFDIDEHAMKAAEYNSMQNGQVNRQFFCGSDNKIFSQVIKKCIPEKTILLLDPPRDGVATNALQEVVNANFQQIIMVSCNPATMARDLKILCESGDYQIKKLQAFDMFPQTAHFEAAALLEKKSEEKLVNEQ